MFSFRMFPINRLMPAIVWAFFIFILSVIPGKELLQSNINQLDKLIHFGFYLILFLLSYHGIESKKKVLVLIVFFLCSVYGFLIECFQGAFLEDRCFDWYDVFANMTGAFIGMSLITLNRQRKNLKKQDIRPKK